MNRSIVLAIGAVLVARSPICAVADSFGSGANKFNIEFVTVGNPGNPGNTADDPHLLIPHGAVAETYRIGKYEVSAEMIDKANIEGGLGIVFDHYGPNKPAADISWFEAATFVNWLNASTGNAPAYKFNSGAFELWQTGEAGYNSANRFRNSLAKYFLPSDDEWYKAAYYDPTTSSYFQYPTGSDLVPIAVASGSQPNTAVYANDTLIGPAEVMLAGGLSPYGTGGQGGNVYEWLETDADGLNDSITSARSLRGGGWYSPNPEAMTGPYWTSMMPADSFYGIGFRVAGVIPEPNTLVMFITGLLAIFWRQTRDGVIVPRAERMSIQTTGFELLATVDNDIGVRSVVDDASSRLVTRRRGR